MMTIKTALPIISVVMPVYNHADYIEKAVRSVLCQKSVFLYELIIGDDASSDGTQDILRKLQAEHPDVIKLILHERNSGVVNNAFEIFKQCRGRYIAILEGDDYWDYELKLQKQIDFLENNHDYVGCFHDARIISTFHNDKDNPDQFHHDFRFYSQFNKYKRDFFVWDVIERNIIPTASLVFRNQFDIGKFFQQFSGIRYSLIWALQIFILADARLRYFNETWSVYNDHAGGISKKISLYEFKQSNISILKIFIKDKNYKHKRNILYKTLAGEYRQLLLNPMIYKERKNVYQRLLFCFLKYSMVALWFDKRNIKEFKKNSLRK